MGLEPGEPAWCGEVGEEAEQGSGFWPSTWGSRGTTREMGCPEQA